MTEAQRKNLEKGWKAAKAKLKNRIHKVCAHPDCNNEFDVKPSLDRVMYCSTSCAKKGKPSPNKGKIASLKTRRKQSLAKYGFRGEKHWNWKGGSSMYKTMRGRIDWKNWREKVFEKDNYTCQLCGKRNLEIHPHHFIGLTYKPELAYKIDNGITVCKNCHYLIHSSQELQVSGWYQKGSESNF